MRYAAFVMLALAPICLIGWILRAGHQASPSMGKTPPASHPSDTVAAATSTGAAKPNDDPLAKIFATPLAGARLKEPVAFYRGQELFEAIDGAAPLFLERRFRALARAEMTMTDGGEFTCEVYDMTDAEHAEAVFLAEKSSSCQPVADMPSAAAAKGFFIFRAGPYYAKLTAFDKAAEAALPQVAKMLADRVR